MCDSLAALEKRVASMKQTAEKDYTKFRTNMSKFASGFISDLSAKELREWVDIYL